MRSELPGPKTITIFPFQIAKHSIFIIIFTCPQGMYQDISEKWKNQCELIKEISQPIDLKSFGFDKMEKNLQKEFQVVQFMTQTQYHVEKLYQNPDHFSYNRNSNIMTFDQNRVVLGEGEDKNSPDHYINANFVDVLDRKIIATQGPLHSTINNFWRMVDKYKVTAIFMLCKKVEKSKVKCDLYWTEKAEEPLEAGDFEVRLLKNEDDNKYTRMRKFLLVNKKTKEEREVTQYQFVGWPDGDKPSEPAQNSLLKLLNIMIQHIENDEKVVVHCSAGVGRTGTFIAMAEIKMLIPKSDSISIFEIVRKLREQRWAMVYTTSQYEFLYEFTEKETLKFFQPQEALSKESAQLSDSDSNHDFNDENPPECN